jgi:hypothetical protein
VDVGVVSEGPIPGVEDAEEARLCRAEEAAAGLH